MKKLWQKQWQLNSSVEAFETKDDILMDQALLQFDVYASLAHATMLVKIGILTQEEYEKAKSGLKEILELSKKGKFLLQMGDEDIHSKIEEYLTTKYGDIGKKIHTGRSRNDQVLTALRLYTKSQLLSLWEVTLQLNDDFLAFAKKHEHLLMPGYTHTQKAMPSSLGMWAGSFVEACLDDVSQIHSFYNHIDSSPLGSAAGYGVPLSLDRAYTAALLGFEKVQVNPIYCQNSRGKYDGETIALLNSILFDINKFATDVILFTSSEFNYLSVDETLCSGSSIMPQKKNVDIAELLRSKIHKGIGSYTQIMSTSSNLISGYNRDLQDNKKPLMELFQTTQEALQMTTLLASSIQPNEEVIAHNMTSDLFATGAALQLVAKGMPFREAYQHIGNNLQDVKATNHNEYREASNHVGGLSNLNLDDFTQQLEEQRRQWKKENDHFENTLQKLLA